MKNVEKKETGQKDSGIVMAPVNAVRKQHLVMMYLAVGYQCLKVELRVRLKKRRKSNHEYISRTDR